MTDELQHLANLIRKKNEVDGAIAQLIERPALAGNIGGFVAARVFGIDLEPLGSHATHDGVFREPPLTGKTVNVKTYSRNEWILDFSGHHCEYYLVMTGPPGPARDRAWAVEAVYLFDTVELLTKLRSRRIKIGVATSVLLEDWEDARIFPARSGAPLRLAKAQVAALKLFGPHGHAHMRESVSAGTRKQVSL
ncbi:MAG TPA: hypothetical protein VF060_12280 [Trebonia sp.]